MSNSNPRLKSRTSTMSSETKNKIITKNLDDGYSRKSILLSNEYDESLSSSSNSSLKKSSSDEDYDTTAAATPNLKMHSISEVSKYLKEKGIESVRYKNDGTLRSKFGDLNFVARESIFDNEVKMGANFFGLFVAFWFCVFFGTLKVIIDYCLQHEFERSKIISIMLRDIVGVGLTDLTMYFSMYISVAIQLLVKSGYLSWGKVGWKLQAIYEVAFVFIFLWWAEARSYPWIAKIFLLLHSLVMLMKIHSYAFYNGYLWGIKSELEFSKTYLKKHEDDDLSDEVKTPLFKSIEFCEFELEVQSKQYPFPTNINTSNFFLYSMYPTLVYEIDYPRSNKIRWRYLLTKVVGIFGVIFLMVALSETFLYPIVMKCLELRETTSVTYRLKAYPLIIVETIPPFLGVYLLVFYLIWELICNAIGELSGFADRDFYRYWWNSVDWNEYSRDWNVLVHKFLLRHVYHSSISAFQVNKSTATLLTFLLSSFVHELAMFVIFKKIRGYLLLLQMSQLPLIELNKSKFMRDRKLLGNCVFWFGIVFGPSLMCTMYLVF